LFFSLFDLPDQLDGLRRSFESSVTEWLNGHSPDFNGVLHAAAAPHASRLAGLSPDVLVSVAEGLRLKTPTDAKETDEGADPIAEPPLRLPAEAPVLGWMWRPPWWCFLLPARWMANWGAQQALRTFSEAMDHYKRVLRDLLVAAGNRWLDEFTIVVEIAIQQRADHIHKMLLTKVARDTFHQIESDLQRVEAMAEQLENGDSAAARADVASTDVPAISPNSLKPCILCRELSTALNSFLATYQYELATNNSRQLSHAECGGFCPLHTWMYEGIASPHGVSAGYPPTLDEVSHRLRSIANSAPATEIAREIARILSHSERCPACRMLENAERHLIMVQAKAIQERLRPALCLPHAGHVLRAVVDDQLAREFVLDRAVVLERIAEDMRLFALKTGAIRSQLAVGDEERAFRRGLQQLVGEKNLAIARRIE
jgi:hypothetical protein